MSAERIALVTDSTCDLPADLRAENGIEMVPLSVFFGDEEYQDNIDLIGEAFYRKLAAAPELPTTSQPPAGKFFAHFQQLQQRGFTHVLCLMINRGFSSTSQSAAVAAKMLPGLTCEILDSRTTSWGLGLMCLYASRLIREGMPFADLVSRMREQSPKALILFSVDTLDALRRGGRIGPVAAYLGKLLHFRPVLKLSGDKPEIQLVKKVTSQAAAFAVMAETLAVQQRTFGIQYGACFIRTATVEPVTKLEAALRAAGMDLKTVYHGTIGAVIGTHLGPDGWGIAIF
jgi:DegV family protein with EDD domain